MGPWSSLYRAELTAPSLCSSLGRAHQEEGRQNGQRGSWALPGQLPKGQVGVKGTEVSPLRTDGRVSIRTALHRDKQRGMRIKERGGEGTRGRESHGQTVTEMQETRAENHSILAGQAAI